MSDDIIVDIDSQNIEVGIVENVISATIIDESVNVNISEPILDVSSQKNKIDVSFSASGEIAIGISEVVDNGNGTITTQ